MPPPKTPKRKPPVRGKWSLLYMLDDDDKPVQVKDDEFEKWAEFMASEKRIVARTKVGHVVVSTVFTGINANWPASPPYLWETTTWGGGCFEREQACSIVEAIACHRVAVARLRKVKQLRNQ